jgi:uncharacterized SAM-binding protein YcdF (DUF218 family)
MKVHMKDGSKPKRRNWAFRVFVVLFLALILGFLGWSCWVYVQIENYAGLNQTAPSDAICVLGAAEYDGRPSPVFRARLDHALELYNRGIAPLIIILGGTNRDAYSEGAVGREYLKSKGVPDRAIIAETESRSTEEQAHRISVIARANNLRRLVVVSDGTHLFRIHEICAADGLNVLTSPRTRVSIGGGTAEAERIAHEILSYTAWRLRMAAVSDLKRVGPLKPILQK